MSSAETSKSHRCKSYLDCTELSGSSLAGSATLPQSVLKYLLCFRTLDERTRQPSNLSKVQSLICIIQCDNLIVELIEGNPGYTQMHKILETCIYIESCLLLKYFFFFKSAMNGEFDHAAFLNDCMGNLILSRVLMLFHIWSRVTNSCPRSQVKIATTRNETQYTGSQ